MGDGGQMPAAILRTTEPMHSLKYSNKLYWHNWYRIAKAIIKYLPYISNIKPFKEFLYFEFELQSELA